MAKQRITVTQTVTRTRYNKSSNKATVTKSSPAGKTSIGSNGKGNPNRCPTCGRYT